MQITEMRGLQTLYSRTQSLYKTHKFYKPFHRFLTQPTTVYDPINNSLITKRVSSESHFPEPPETDKHSVYKDALKEDRSYESIVNPNKGFRPGKKKGKIKSKSRWVCSDCGYSDGQWWGYCRECKSIGTMREFIHKLQMVNPDVKIKAAYRILQRD